MQARMPRWRPSRLATTSMMLLLTFIGGCALPRIEDTETAEYRRIDAQLRAIDQYQAFVRSCRAAGGIVYTTRSRGGIRPKLEDISTIECARRRLGR